MENEVINLANNQDLHNTDNLGFNIDFQESELDGAIYRLKLGKSPGPDSLYPEMLHHAGEFFRKSILHIFNLSWCTGKLPDPWRHASSAVGNVSGYRCVSDCRSRGREFDPGPVPYFRGD